MGGSGRGISDARQGKADIGMVSRAPGESERDLSGLPIARDGVAIIGHKDNPVSALSDRQLLDIYSGKIANWRQVGGRDALLHVLAGPPEGGSNCSAITCNCPTSRSRPRGGLGLTPSASRRWPPIRTP